MLVEPLLRRLVVVGRDDEDGIGPGLFGVGDEVDRLEGAVGARSGDDGDPAVRDLDAELDHPLVLVMGQRRRLAGGADRHETMTSLRDLPVHVAGESLFIEGAVLGEGRHEGGDRSLEHYLLLRPALAAALVLVFFEAPHHNAAVGTPQARRGGRPREEKGNREDWSKGNNPSFTLASSIDGRLEGFGPFSHNRVKEIKPPSFASMMKTYVLALTTIALAATGPALPAHAFSLSPHDVPVPLARPFLPQTDVVPQFAAAPSDEVTASIGRLDNPATAVGTLKEGLDALTGRDVARARAVLEGMPAGSLDRHILLWAIALSGSRDVASPQISAAARQLQGWPGLDVLRDNSERALYRENPPAARVLAAFGKSRPQTAEGTIVLARALLATGQRGQAEDIVRHLWRNDALDADTETKILDEFSGLLRRADHFRRMEMLLYRSRPSQAKRIADLANAQSLYRAWAAVIRRQPDAEALIRNVDPGWRSDPGYTFVRVSYLRDNDHYEQAARLLATIPHDEAALVDPGQWWDEERIVSRGLLDLGDFKTAYRLAADNVARSDVDRVDAEFHAGWYALRGLLQPATAEKHFRRIVEISNSPLSLSRGYYWLARAAEAGGPGKASDYYARAAAYPATFYGQLAAAKLGRNAVDVSYPSPTTSERDRFAQREPVRAIKRLEDVGYDWRAGIIYRALARELKSPGELAILAAMAERNGDDQLSLQIGKIAYARGIDCAALAFPIGAIPRDANISGTGMALAYAVARQESAFNKAAVSAANARGLLQLLPTTAKRVAARHGMSYSKARLTEDAAYNATLGAHYLGEQISDFDGSYILTFIAYNAGPNRVPEWIQRFGDPRGKPIDQVVDWIERIPFTETRNYVQRVMENYEVYKARLGQPVDIVHDLRFGRS